MPDLFPEIPEDLKSLSDDDLTSLLEDHEEMAKAIQNDPSELAQGLTADDFLEEYRRGKDQLLTLRTEVSERAEAFENFNEEIKAISSEIEVKAEEETPEVEETEEVETEEVTEEAVAEVVAEAEAVTEEAVLEPVAAAADPPKRVSRVAPMPSQERQAPPEPQQGAALVAAGGYRGDFREPLTASTLAELQRAAMDEHGPAEHNGQKTVIESGLVRNVYPDGKVETLGPTKAVFDGPKVKTARAEFEFPSDRILTGGDDDVEKIRAALPSYVEFAGGRGGHGGEALVASGGLCAPLTPIYTMPNFATDAEPVWASLPIFAARRGGVNVPVATDISDITTAISSISEANDALGGTFATKSCQALDCPDYTETAVQILAHCREYGNLNARAWPEKIAHENALTMAALARTTELFMVDRIKTLSINLTQAEVLGAYGDFVQAALRARSGIISRLRMETGAVFNLLVPEWLPSMFAADTAYTQFDRYQNQAQMTAHLESLGFRTVLYKDGATGGTSQTFADEVAGTALDDFPDDVQWGIYPEGQFLGIDMGVLELGIVRDSTLNSTNDFQVFGERFRNLAMLGPAQGALWIVQAVCPSGEFPALGTALTC